MLVPFFFFYLPSSLFTTPQPPRWQSLVLWNEDLLKSLQLFNVPRYMNMLKITLKKEEGREREREKWAK